MSARLVLALALAAACKGKSDRVDDNMKTLGGEQDPGSSAPVVEPIDLDSKDILGRTTVGQTATVKHILLGWKELGPNYVRQKQKLDERAAARTNAEAAKLAQDLAAKLRKDPQLIHSLAKQFSEDYQMAMMSEPYTVGVNDRLAPEFKRLALRLERGETGIVRSDYGYHVITRLAVVRDPIESVAILERKDVAPHVWVQSILIGWKDTQAVKQGRLPDPRAKDRTREDAAKLATEVLAQAAKATDMVALMKRYSEDIGSMTSGAPYEITADSGMVESYVELALRLKLDEAGIVQSPLGWHIIKRIAPPPDDPLESTEILARKSAATRVKVKHIQLGWTAAHTTSPRGQQRERAELEKLVATTRARIAKGEKFEALMKELSEHDGTAKSGEGFEISTSASIVPRLRTLALALAVGEVGVVKTQRGIHIVKRIE